MQQTHDFIISEEFHAKLHNNRIEHTNVDIGRNVPAVRITLEFDETPAAEQYPLTKEHTFRFDKYVYIPRRQDNGLYMFENADFNGRISSQPVEPKVTGVQLYDLVYKELMTNFRNVIDINHIIIYMMSTAREEYVQACREADVLEEQRKKLYAEQEAKLAEERRIKEEEQRVQREEKEKKETEHLASQLAWIKEYGSEKLKKSFEKNYKCKKLYLLERLKHDVGENYLLDYNGDIKRKARSCPSMEALLEVERIESIEGIADAKVVWLPHGLNTPDDYEKYDSGSEGIEAKFFGYYIYSVEY